MKDVISAISGILAFVVFLYCVVQGTQIETALLRALVTFVAANIIGFFAFGFTVVIIHQNKKQDIEEIEPENSKQAPAKA